MTVIEFYNRLCELYPSSLSASWDNDGLMCCHDKDAAVNKVLVSLDATEAAINYAKDNGFDLLLTHHPLIFRGIKELNDCHTVGRRLLCAVKAGISVISLHTRLDAGEKGVNHILASLLGLTDITFFGDSDCPTLGRIGSTDITSPEVFAKKIKDALKAPAVTAYISGPVHRVAVIGGAGDLCDEAICAGADTLVTGECGYNKALDAAENGLNVFLAGHYFTEIPVCQRLKELSESLMGAKTEIFANIPEIHF